MSKPAHCTLRQLPCPSMAGTDYQHARQRSVVPLCRHNIFCITPSIPMYGCTGQWRKKRGRASAPPHLQGPPPQHRRGRRGPAPETAAPRTTADAAPPRSLPAAPAPAQAAAQSFQTARSEGRCCRCQPPPGRLRLHRHRRRCWGPHARHPGCMPLCNGGLAAVCRLSAAQRQPGGLPAAAERPSPLRQLAGQHQQARDPTRPAWCVCVCVCEEPPGQGCVRRSTLAVARRSAHVTPALTPAGARHCSPAAAQPAEPTCRGHRPRLETEASMTHRRSYVVPPLPGPGAAAAIPAAAAAAAAGDPAACLAGSQMSRNPTCTTCAEGCTCACTGSTACRPSTDCGAAPPPPQASLPPCSRGPAASWLTHSTQISAENSSSAAWVARTPADTVTGTLQDWPAGRGSCASSAALSTAMASRPRASLCLHEMGPRVWKALCGVGR